ncbi:MAG: nickel/cobalt transporter [Rhizobiales bacterium]|nr:nickel/cobalt transporter [Hyphomicrobiales bacterium]MBO6700141.1 nickel/cobalt transporter [Hyphomicrobiales bacterium]MBO6737694.1 nickel/cobalt transporter [Hyphomicrobiales bacterium]MBO6913249.1 nickel/cobalt transporter [Hyphomicrobiales bacterium]MBO6954293.1 nickel/cobalt transporter [Hyphomicrobiales bacterium]
MSRRFMLVLLIVLAVAIFAATAVSGVSANPFGPVVPTEPVPGFGFDRLIAWTAQTQGAFYDGLTSALRQVSESSAALWTLLGLSFAYGVAHAAGPGHGKVVISSYMLANGDTARRGAMLAIGAALVQATVAVVLVAVLAGAFGLSRTFLTDATITLERFSYGLIVVLGLYLVWRTVKGLLPQPAQPAVLAAAGHHHSHSDAHPDPHHVHDAHCGCDHVHMPDAGAVSRTAGLGQSLMLILGAGARPCTGALLVLVLAMSQGLLWAGTLSAYAMGVGTALTVGTLAVFASGLSGLFQRSGETSPVMRYAPLVLSLLGGLIVVAFGALLLLASLSR